MAFVNNSSLESDDSPLIEWTPNNNVSILGWGIEIDSTDEFNSPDKISAVSWSDSGFDVINNQYLLQSSLQIGQQWFWRVRALSSTYHLENGHQNSIFTCQILILILSMRIHTLQNFITTVPLDNSNALEFLDTSIVDSVVPTSNLI